MSVADSEQLTTIMHKLKAQKNIGDDITADLYSHLTEVFSRIMQYHPYDAFEKFEEISILVKQTNFHCQDPAHDFEINGQIAKKYGKVTNKEALRAIEVAQALLSEKPYDVSVHDRNLLTTNQKVCIPNLERNAAMLEWAGVNFSEERVTLMQKSLKRLATMSGATHLRLFGKIYGVQRDYWIASGKLPFQEEKPLPNQEKRGEGANSQVYWVTQDVLSDWI